MSENNVEIKRKGRPPGSKNKEKPDPRLERQAINKAAFLEALTILPVIKTACKRVGISHQTYYDWRRDDLAFLEQVDVALEAGKLSIEAAVSEYGFYINNDSELLVNDGTTARWLLERQYPEKYSRTQKVEHSGSMGAQINVTFLPAAEQAPDASTDC